MWEVFEANLINVTFAQCYIDYMCKYSAMEAP